MTLPTKLPRGLSSLEDCAFAANLPPATLKRSLRASGVPIFELRLGKTAREYVERTRFDAWFLAAIKPAEV